MALANADASHLHPLKRGQHAETTPGVSREMT
jgi:hypothetical protein